MPRIKWTDLRVCSYILFLAFLLTFAILFASACKEDETGLIFSHKKHTEVGGEIEATCDACHQIDEDGLKVKIPTHEECRNCHEIDEEQPSEKCLKCHSRKDRKVEIKKKIFFIEDVIFSHKNHLDLGVECDTCHAKIRKTSKFTAPDIPHMDVCMKCHKEKGGSLECKTCHKKIREGTRPKSHEVVESPISHNATWGITHGKEVEKEGQKCILCHQKSQCDQCHTTQKPKSHTLTWKQAVHGRFATMNRFKCATCHEADFCSRCHERMPTTHYDPSFKLRHKELARVNTRSCVVCHDKSFCLRCHREGLKFDRLVQ